MKGKILAAFGLSLSIIGVVVSTVGIVLSACSLGIACRRPSHIRSMNSL